KTIKAWRFASDQPTKNLPHPNFVDAAAFSPDGNLLASGCHDGILRIWDYKPPQPVATKAINAHVVQGQPPAPIYT
ncbi:WD40 repeat domain-containing protein, partial [Vibrio parahaemolyticus]